MRADPLLQFRRISLDPAKDRRVIHRDTALLQHEREIAIADREHQIPPHRPEDHLGRELPPAFEGLVRPDPDRLSPFRHAPALPSPVRRRKLATEPSPLRMPEASSGTAAMLVPTNLRCAVGSRWRTSASPSVGSAAPPPDP